MIETTYTAGTSPATTDPAVDAAKAQAKKDGASKEMFLQLLVAQIKNQNPLSPTDGVQFLTQLSQFTEVEQLTGMRADLAAVRSQLETTTKAAGQTKGAD